MLKTDTELGDVSFFQPKQRRPKPPARGPAATSFRLAGGISRTSSRLSRLSGRTPSLHSKASNYSLQSSVSKRQQPPEWYDPGMRPALPSNTSYDPSSGRGARTAEEAARDLTFALRRQKDQETMERHYTAARHRHGHHANPSLSTFRSTSSIRSAGQTYRPRSPFQPRSPQFIRRSPPPAPSSPQRSPRRHPQAGISRPFRPASPAYSDFVARRQPSQHLRPMMRSYNSNPAPSMRPMQTRDPGHVPVRRVVNGMPHDTDLEHPMASFSARGYADTTPPPANMDSGAMSSVSKGPMMLFPPQYDERSRPPSARMMSPYATSSAGVHGFDRANPAIHDTPVPTSDQVGMQAGRQPVRSTIPRPLRQASQHDMARRRSLIPVTGPSGNIDPDALVDAHTPGRSEASATSTPCSVAAPYRNIVTKMTQQFEDKAASWNRSVERQNVVGVVHRVEPEPLPAPPGAFPLSPLEQPAPSSLSDLHGAHNGEPVDMRAQFGTPLRELSLHHAREHDPAVSGRANHYNGHHSHSKMYSPSPARLSLNQHGVGAEEDGLAQNPRVTTQFHSHMMRNVPVELGAPEYTLSPGSDQLEPPLFNQTSSRPPLPMSSQAAATPKNSNVFEESFQSELQKHTPHPTDSQRSRCDSRRFVAKEETGSARGADDHVQDPVDDDAGNDQEDLAASTSDASSEQDLRHSRPHRYAESVHPSSDSEEEHPGGILDQVSDDATPAVDSSHPQEGDWNRSDSGRRLHKESLSGSPGPTRSISSGSLDRSLTKPKDEDCSPMRMTATRVTRIDGPSELPITHEPRPSEDKLASSPYGTLHDGQGDLPRQSGGYDSLHLRASYGSSILGYRPDSLVFGARPASVQSGPTPAALYAASAKSRTASAGVETVRWSYQGSSHVSDNLGDTSFPSFPVNFPKFASRPTSTDTSVFSGDARSSVGSIATDARPRPLRINRYGLQDLTEDSADTSTTNVRQLTRHVAPRKSASPRDAALGGEASAAQSRPAKVPQTYLDPKARASKYFGLPDLKFSYHDLTTSLNLGLGQTSPQARIPATTSSASLKDGGRPRSATEPPHYASQATSPRRDSRYRSLFLSPEDAESVHEQPPSPKPQSLQEPITRPVATSLSTVDPELIEELNSIQIPQADGILASYNRLVRGTTSRPDLLLDGDGDGVRETIENIHHLDSAETERRLSEESLLKLTPPDTSEVKSTESTQPSNSTKSLNLQKELPPLPTEDEVPSLVGTPNERIVSRQPSSNYLSTHGTPHVDVHELPGSDVPSLALKPSASDLGKRNFSKLNVMPTPDGRSWTNNANFTFSGNTPDMTLRRKEEESPTPVGRFRTSPSGDEHAVAIARSMSPGFHGSSTVPESADGASLGDAGGSAEGAKKGGIFGSVTNKLRRKSRYAPRFSEPPVLDRGFLHPEASSRVISVGERYPGASPLNLTPTSGLDDRSLASDDESQEFPPRQSFRKRVSSRMHPRGSRYGVSPMYTNSETYSEPHELAQPWVHGASSSGDHALPRSQSESNLQMTLTEIPPNGMSKTEFRTKRFLMKAQGFFHHVGEMLRLRRKRG